MYFGNILIFMERNKNLFKIVLYMVLLIRGFLIS